MPTAIASIRAACRRCIVFAILPCLLCPQASLAWTASPDIELAAKYCANDTGPVRLSEDGKILCFDGPIHNEAPIDLIKKLNDHGFFVVRSPGGYAPVAMTIADTLLERDATVVVHDYCLSACANYILVATDRTYVLRDSIVAWHGGLARPGCGSFPIPERESPFHRYVEGRCEDVAQQAIFFQKRGIQSAYIFGPRTTFTRMMYNTTAKNLGRRRAVFWMWNPGNYGDHFKGRILFERYPGSQQEVDRLMGRFNLVIPGQIIYDPDL